MNHCLAERLAYTSGALRGSKIDPSNAVAQNLSATGPQVLVGVLLYLPGFDFGAISTRHGRHRMSRETHEIGQVEQKHPFGDFGVGLCKSGHIVGKM